MTRTTHDLPQPARNHLRRFWKHHLGAVAAIAVIAIFLAGVFSAKHLYVCGVRVDGTAAKNVCGIHLGPNGQKALKEIAGSDELGNGAISVETPPPKVIARLNEQAAAEKHVKPFTLATPEPVTATRLVRNYSSRNGHRPALFVVHDTESPNVAGMADVDAIAAWFNNTSSQASSNYTTDAAGNTLLMVPDTEKAWTQAYFNSWSISDEMIGYANQRSWPDVQLRAVAQIAAREMAKYGIPVQQGAVSGCTIIRPGIVQHSNLGQCGGGHHDAGPAFPITRFVQLVKQYQAGGLHPKPAPKKGPAWYRKAAKLKPMWAWISWRDHHHPAKLRPKQIPKRVPKPWWHRYAIHIGAA